VKPQQSSNVENGFSDGLNIYGGLNFNQDEAEKPRRCRLYIAVQVYQVLRYLK